ncbi:MAG TPA: hypothetical protein VE404_06715 [Verrucomicrobiae bacterium]|nr:hypothetical protein [Verrucomicrobiae bacterium]
MSAAELHLAVNHLPVLGPPFAAAVLAGAIRRRSAELASAGFLVMVGVGLAAIVAYRSGLGASDVVADLADVSATAIEEHLHAARLLLWACVGSAVASLVALARTTRRGGYNSGEAAVALVLALALTGAGAWTAHLGGEIRHSEVR